MEGKKERKKPVRVIPVQLRNTCVKVIEAMKWKAFPLRSPKDVYVVAVNRGNFVFYLWFGDIAKDQAKFKASQDFLGGDVILYSIKDLQECMDILRKYEVEFAKHLPVEA